MKYIDAKKLNSLIDKKLEDLGMSGSVWVGRSVLCELKDEIKSIQQEQSEVDLEEEVEKFCLGYDTRKEVWFDMTPSDKKMLSTPTWSNFASNIARHFYELGLNARKEE